MKSAVIASMAVAASASSLNLPNAVEHTTMATVPTVGRALLGSHGGFTHSYVDACNECAGVRRYVAYRGDDLEPSTDVNCDATGAGFASGEAYHHQAYSGAVNAGMMIDSTNACTATITGYTYTCRKVVEGKTVSITADNTITDQANNICFLAERGEAGAPVVTGVPAKMTLVDKLADLHAITTDEENPNYNAAFANSGYGILTGLVGRLGLGDALAVDTPRTMLAPTDLAFIKYATGDAETPLTLEETNTAIAAISDEALTAVVMNHLIPTYMANVAAADGLEVTTEGGSTYTWKNSFLAPGYFYLFSGDCWTWTTASGFNYAQFPGSYMETYARARQGVVLGVNSVLDPAGSCPVQPQSLYKTISDDAELSTLKAAVDAAGLKDTLMETDQTTTIMAPTNAAFDALFAMAGTTADAVLALPTLSSILQFHVIPGTVMSTDITDGLTADTLLGPSQTITFTVSDDVVMAHAGAQAATVTAVDMLSEGSVVHKIDAVLIGANVVDQIKSSADHSTLAAALDATGYSAPLSAMDKQYTVLAPGNAAFDTLFAMLEVDAAAVLASGDILKYFLATHVFGFYADFANAAAAGSTGTTVPTVGVAGDFEYVTLSVTEADGVTSVHFTGSGGNTATVTQADIKGINGIIHVVDAVLISARALELAGGGDDDDDDDAVPSCTDECTAYPVDCDEVEEMTMDGCASGCNMEELLGVATMVMEAGIADQECIDNIMDMKMEESSSHSSHSSHSSSASEVDSGASAMGIFLATVFAALML